MNCMFESLAWLSKLAIVFIDPSFIGFICPQGNSFINYILGFTICLGPNTVMIAGLSSQKSRLISDFRIAALSRGIVLNRGSIEKL